MHIYETFCLCKNAHTRYKQQKRRVQNSFVEKFRKQLAASGHNNSCLEKSWKIIPRKSAISFIVFWDFWMFYQIFLSPQVKRCAIITYKHGIYELPYELPNDLRLRKLENIRKLSKPHRMIAQCPAPPPKWKLCQY